MAVISLSLSLSLSLYIYIYIYICISWRVYKQWAEFLKVAFFGFSKSILLVDYKYVVSMIIVRSF